MMRKSVFLFSMVQFGVIALMHGWMNPVGLNRAAGWICSYMWAECTFDFFYFIIMITL